MAEGHSLAAASAASRRQNLSFWLSFCFYRLAPQALEIAEFRTEFTQRHGLFYLFFQVEIRYRHLPSNQTFPARSRRRPRNYHSIMATKWWIGFHPAMVASGRRPSCSREPKCRVDAIRRLGLPPLLCRLTPTPAANNFAPHKIQHGMKAADCIRPTH
jgi:hypothetical protein